MPDEKVPLEDFDSAYDWFSREYAEPQGVRPLLSEREAHVFSQFLDTIVTEPANSGPSPVSRAQFLDDELWSRGMNPAQAAKSDFYRGFVGQSGHLPDLPKPTEKDSSSQNPSHELAQNDPRRREFLSRDQIRQNHIQSEKRRRDMIKRLFSEMCELVSEISDSKEQLSKAAILNLVHEHIIRQARFNQLLRARLAKAGVEVNLDCPSERVPT